MMGRRERCPQRGRGLESGRVVGQGMYLNWSPEGERLGWVTIGKVGSWRPVRTTSCSRWLCSFRRSWPAVSSVWLRRWYGGGFGHPDPTEAAEDHRWRCHGRRWRGAGRRAAGAPAGQRGPRQG